MIAAAATLVVPKLNISSRFLGDKLSVEERNFWKSSARRGLTVRRTKCAVDMPYGGGGGVAKFNRMFVWDPYKRLGISKDASDDEIWGARNFLLDQYSQDESSYESIEGAFEKLLMTSFRERKRTKMNLKSRLKRKVEESPPWIKSILGFVEIPPGVIVLRRLFLFGFMACWSVMNSAETGPAFQVAISLGACVYFLNDKMKNLGRAAITGFLALVVGWILGSIMVPSIPRFLLQPTWTLELLTSLVVYASFFLACTFLK